MYWRNRINFKDRALSNIERNSYVNSGSPIVKFQANHRYIDEVFDDEFPDSIIVQVSIKTYFKNNESTFVKAEPNASAISVYGDQFSMKAIEKIEFMFDGFIYEPNKSNDWIKNIELPTCLWSITFDTLEDGVHVFDKEKRLPQDEILEQSLWSYGATYSADFDICQVGLTKIIPVCVNNATFLRCVRAKSPDTLGDKISNGSVQIPLSEGLSYSSYFIKNITFDKAHIYLKKM